MIFTILFIVFYLYQLVFVIGCIFIVLSRCFLLKKETCSPASFMTNNNVNNIIYLLQVFFLSFYLKQDNKATKMRGVNECEGI